MDMIDISLSSISAFENKSYKMVIEVVRTIRNVIDNEKRYKYLIFIILMVLDHVTNVTE